jgi:UTP-glucose-1-phosphate uridylyltransferase
MKFASENIEVERLSVGKDLYWVFADLKGNKDTKRILTALNACYPFAQTEIERGVQRALGDENVRIVEQVIKAMKVGDAARIGSLMNEVQQIFDRLVAPACPSELNAPILHEIIRDPTVQSLSLGCKGVGSQGDGTIQFICKDEASQQMLCEYLIDVRGLDAYCFQIKAQRSVRKAVIPVAGFGTRLFPATKVVKKEFFPIIDYDGVIKPALMVLLEELERAGLEEIALIIQPDEKKEYERLFMRDLKLNQYRSLPNEKRDYNVHIQNLGRKITYLYQEEQLGFGHAVYQAKQFAGDEPVLMVLGDHLYHTDNPMNCTAQLIDAFEKTGMLTVSLDEVTIEQVNHYGIAEGDFIEGDKRIMQVNQIVEKPTMAYAKEFLGVRNEKSQTKYYSVFGQYVLTPKVFELLERNIQEEYFENGEIQLTNVLDEIRRNDGLVGYLVDGKRYDIGLPEAYRETVSRFGLRQQESNAVRE